MTHSVPVAVLGAGGRMGRSILRCLAEFPGLALSGALARKGAGDHPDAELIRLLGPVTPAADPGTAVAGSQVAIDFTLPAAVAGNLAACVEQGTAAVVGVTGLGGAERRALEESARSIPVFYAANMSTGVGLLAELVSLAGRLAPGQWEAGLLDVHHSAKRDAPSGTALALEEAFRTGAGDNEAAVAHAALRVGDVTGEHTLWLSGPGERLELTHRATDRSIFARGALRAAAWLVGQPPGLYGMAELLASGLDTVPAGPLE